MMSVKLHAVLLLLVLFLSGCGLSLNQPVMGPDGTIAVFLDETGTYDFLLEGGILTLLSDDSTTQIDRADPAIPASALDWSLDGAELLFGETELGGEWGAPSAWNLCVTEPWADSEPLTLLSSVELITNAAFTAEGNVTYLVFDEEGSGALMLLDRAEDTQTCLLRNVLSYQPAVSKLSLTVIQLDESEGFPKARVSTYVPATGEMEPIASFLLTMQMEEILATLGCFLWDMDSSGTCLALALYDQLLIDPEVEVDAPSLYLVDTIEETGRRIALLAVMPAFSPDDSLLAYVSVEDEQDSAVYLYNRETEEKKKVPNSDGAVAFFWIDEGTLGVTFETDDETYQLMKILLDTGELLPLAGS